jgi:hypothetical protein
MKSSFAGAVAAVSVFGLLALDISDRIDRRIAKAAAAELAEIDPQLAGLVEAGRLRTWIIETQERYGR